MAFCLFFSFNLVIANPTTTNSQVSAVCIIIIVINYKQYNCIIVIVIILSITILPFFTKSQKLTTNPKD